MEQVQYSPAACSVHPADESKANAEPRLLAAGQDAILGDAGEHGSRQVQAVNLTVCGEPKNTAHRDCRTASISGSRSRYVAALAAQLWNQYRGYMEYPQGLARVP
jgi:hypothetical protein